MRTLLALFLSGTFLAAAVAKLHDSWGLRLTVRDLLPSWPRALVHGIAFTIIGTELLVALSFTAGPRALGLVGSAGTLGLAACFVSAFALSRRASHPVHCQCFGRLSAATLSGSTLAISAALAACAACWPFAHGGLATFAAYQPRLVALLPAIAVLIAHRVPALAASHPSAPARRAVKAARSGLQHHRSGS